MLTPSRELEFLKFLDKLTQDMRSIREPRKALGHALRVSRAFFQAGRGCVAVLEPGDPEARLLLTVPREGTWDLQHIGRFIRHTHPPARSDLMMAPVRRRGAAWGAMAFIRQQPAFDRDDGRLLARVTATVSDAVHSMDRERMLEIRDRIDRKIMEQIHPKDLFYQILDGLRSLTHYDHSSALLIRDNGEDTLRVVAEQISWTKARSHRIGLTLPLDAALQPTLASGAIASRMRSRLRTIPARRGFWPRGRPARRWRRAVARFHPDARPGAARWAPSNRRPDAPDGDDASAPVGRSA